MQREILSSAKQINNCNEPHKMIDVGSEYKDLDFHDLIKKHIPKFIGP